MRGGEVGRAKAAPFGLVAALLGGAAAGFSGCPSDDNTKATGTVEGGSFRPESNRRQTEWEKQVDSQRFPWISRTPPSDPAVVSPMALSDLAKEAHRRGVLQSEAAEFDLIINRTRNEWLVFHHQGRAYQTNDQGLTWHPLIVGPWCDFPVASIISDTFVEDTLCVRVKVDAGEKGSASPGPGEVVCTFDGTKTWQSCGSIGFDRGTCPDPAPARIFVHQSAPRRIFAYGSYAGLPSGFSGQAGPIDGGMRAPSLHVSYSDDLGATWQPTPAFDTSSSLLYLYNPEVVIFHDVVDTKFREILQCDMDLSCASRKTTIAETPELSPVEPDRPPCDVQTDRFRLWRDGETLRRSARGSQDNPEDDDAIVWRSSKWEAR